MQADTAVVGTSAIVDWQWQFHLVNDLPVDFLVGTHFMQSMMATINLNPPTLTMQGLTIPCTVHKASSVNLCNEQGVNVVEDDLPETEVQICMVGQDKWVGKLCALEGCDKPVETVFSLSLRDNGAY